MSDISTRQRLNDLWEKCPKCAPRVVGWHERETDGSFITRFDEVVSEGTLDDLSCIALVRWLINRNHKLDLMAHKNRVYLPMGLEGDGMQSEGPTLIDALISAVEGVLALDAAVSSP